MMIAIIFLIRLFFDHDGSPPAPKWLKAAVVIPFILTVIPAMVAFHHPCTLQPGVEYPALGENPSFCSINTGFQKFVYGKSEDGAMETTRGGK
jgi:hypothetical protein